MLRHACPKCEIGFCGPNCTCACHKNDSAENLPTGSRRRGSLWDTRAGLPLPAEIEKAFSNAIERLKNMTPEEKERLHEHLRACMVGRDPDLERRLAPFRTPVTAKTLYTLLD